MLVGSSWSSWSSLPRRAGRRPGRRRTAAAVVRARAAQRVAVFSSTDYWRASMQPAAVAHGYELSFLSAALDAQSAELARGCRVACAFVNDDLGADALGALRGHGVELVAMRCAGFDKVDLAAARDLGMRVVRVPAYSPYAVAEHAVGAVLCLNRRLHKAYARVREGNFTLDGLVGYDVRGKTVGVIGTGKIGRCFASCLSGFGAELLAYDVRESEEARALGVRYCGLDELLGRSHIVSLHLPLNPRTEHIIDDAALGKMREGAILVNVSRGGLIDTAAALRALRSGRLGGLALDVYEREEGLFFRDFSNLSSSDLVQHREARPDVDNLALLLSYPNVLITPHAAFLTHEALGNIAETTFANIDEFFAGGAELTNEVRAS